MATKAKQKVINLIDQMPLEELKARRTQIAEQIISSNVHWEIDKDGNYHSMLDKTDYWKIKAKIEEFATIPVKTKKRINK